MKDRQSLPEDWDERDSHDSFYEYVKLCREEQIAGKPLPAMFVPGRDRGDDAAQESMS